MGMIKNTKTHNRIQIAQKLSLRNKGLYKYASHGGNVWSSKQWDTQNPSRTLVFDYTEYGKRRKITNKSAKKMSAWDIIEKRRNRRQVRVGSGNFEKIRKKKETNKTTWSQNYTPRNIHQFQSKEKSNDLEITRDLYII